MISKSEKLKILQKILNSPELSDSSRYQELLQYLVDTSLHDKPIKETSIAIDFFNKDASFNPIEDPTVRVYVSNLRKKLDHYYLTGGKDDPIRLAIPKGHYHVEFVQAQAEEMPEPLQLRRLYFSLLFALLAVSVLFNGFLLSRRQNNTASNTISPNNAIWREFLQKNNVPTLLVLGDYFFLYERHDELGRGYMVRDPRINSPEDFKQALKSNPYLINRYVALDYSYLSPSSTWCTVELLPHLWNAPNQIYLKLASELVWADLSRHNVIFVGSFKTLYVFNELMPVFNFKVNVYPPRIEWMDIKTDSALFYDPVGAPSSGNVVDYSIVVKYPGPNNNSIIMIMGFDETSIIEGAKAITNSDFISRLKNQYAGLVLQDPLYFEMLVEVEGIKRFRSGLRADIKHFRTIVPKRDIGSLR